MTSPRAPRPGVTRRVLLRGGGVVPALWMLARAAQSRRASRRPDEVAAFLRSWADRTAELVEREDPDEEGHLHDLCAGLTRLDPGAFPPRTQVAFQGGGTTSGPVFGDVPFLVLRFDLEPGAIIRAHNHVGWSFVSLGVRGEAAVRHFEPLREGDQGGEPPDPGAELGVDFLIREVSSCLLSPGRMSTLTRTRANIHWFRAGEEGATFLDFGIKYPDPGGGPRSFSVLEFDPDPTDAVRRIHVARWLGNVYAKK